jgi:hypothetical protein
MFGFDPATVHAGFVEEKITLSQVFPLAISSYESSVLVLDASLIDAT